MKDFSQLSKSHQLLINDFLKEYSIDFNQCSFKKVQRSNLFHYIQKLSDDLIISLLTVKSFTNIEVVTTNKKDTAEFENIIRKKENSYSVFQKMKTSNKHFTRDQYVSAEQSIKNTISDYINF